MLPEPIVFPSDRLMTATGCLIRQTVRLYLFLPFSPALFWVLTVTIKLHYD
jgi:hypothetical protein